MTHLLDFFLSLDVYLVSAVADYGIFIYLILFLVIFTETGLVVTPFLPGDSLLFVAGALAGQSLLNPWGLFILLFLAAVTGDALNYWLGHLIGAKVFSRPDAKIFRPEYLNKTHSFYARYGAETIIIARFIPIVRTFAPFVAGASRMTYSRFSFYNLTGAALWIGLFISTGYFFGNIPLVADNLSLVIMSIIFLSLLPPLFEYIRHRKSSTLTK